MNYDSGPKFPNSVSLRLDAGITLPGETRLEIAVDIVAPENPASKILFCLPGGGMNRRYFDLHPPAGASGSDLQATGDDSYSFAQQMAQRGFASVLVDHLGVGDSTRPEDGYALTPAVLAQANANVVREVLQRLRQGVALAGLAPMQEPSAVGIGHSMGALLAIVQQAQYRQFIGVAVLGFSTRGLPEYLTPEMKALDDDGRRRELVRLARATFRESYPVLGRTGDGAQLYSGKTAEAAGVEAIKAARDRLLPVPAFLSMLPGNVAAEAAAIDVPVFVGLGENDMAGPPLDVPKAFTGSPAVTFHLLPQSGHSHFLFAARAGLFEQLAEWAASLSS